MAVLAMRHLPDPSARFELQMFSACDKFEVIEIAASAVFATMVELKPIRHWTVGKLIRQIVRLANFPLITDAAISGARSPPPDDAL